jgi:hypothetical protein
LGTTLDSSGGIDPGETAKIRRDLVVSGETRTSAVTRGAWCLRISHSSIRRLTRFPEAHALSAITPVRCTVSPPRWRRASRRALRCGQPA